MPSDGSDDDHGERDGDGAGGFDYELQTAKQAAEALGAGAAAGSETVEGMRDRLQAESEVRVGGRDYFLLP